jgi:hypothetical protein
MKAVLSRPLFAFLATTSEEGPRSSPVWFLWEDAAIWIIANQGTDTFPSRIEQDPRCAVAIVDFDGGTGIVHHVGMRGAAAIQPFDVKRAKRLLRRYLGENEAGWDRRRFIEPLSDQDNVMIRFEPETVVVRDQSYKRTPSPVQPGQ